MIGRRSQGQRHLFYEFDLDETVPDDHLVRKVDAVLNLSWIHAELAPHYYSRVGRPSIDPVMMIRMLIVRYVFAIGRSDSFAESSKSTSRIGGFAIWAWKI